MTFCWLNNQPILCKSAEVLLYHKKQEKGRVGRLSKAGGSLSFFQWGILGPPGPTKMCLWRAVEKGGMGVVHPGVFLFCFVVFGKHTGFGVISFGGSKTMGCFWSPFSSPEYGHFSGKQFVAI